MLKKIHTVPADGVAYGPYSSQGSSYRSCLVVVKHKASAVRRSIHVHGMRGFALVLSSRRQKLRAPMGRLAAPTVPMYLGSPQQEGLLASGLVVGIAGREPRVPGPTVGERPQSPSRLYVILKGPKASRRRQTPHTITQALRPALPARVHLLRLSSRPR